MELKFMYDVLFSKSSSTAFGVYGALMRFLNTSLLAGACLLLFCGWKDNQTQQTVTYVLLSVALAVEAFQLCRIAVSDWTMVRLICAYIQHFRRPRCGSRYSFRLIRMAMSFLGKVRKWLGDQYWSKTINQYSVIDACFTSSRYVWDMAEFITLLRNFIVPSYIKAIHVEEEPVRDDLKRFIFQKLKARCSPQQDIAICRGRVYAFDEYLLATEWQDLQWASQMDLEDLILTWHIATTICERHRQEKGETDFAENVGFSRTLSRYCAYLLVSQANLLPLHADIAKMTYIEVHYEIVGLHNTGGPDCLKDYNCKSAVGLGAKLARQLQNKQAEERWEILAEYWAGLVIYIAVYNKATLHAECLPCGGEFLSQLWVLLGHLGCGEQSDSAVTKKREEKTMKEKEEEQKRRKIEEDTWRDEEKNRRREEIKKRRGEEQKARRKEDQNRDREEEKTEFERSPFSWLLEV